MPVNMANVQAALKEVYGPRIESQVPTEVVTLKRVERSSDGITSNVGGKYVTFPLHVSRNTGISYRAEEGQIAPPGRQGYAVVQIGLRYGYGRFKFTGQVMSLASSNTQAFADMADEEMTRLKDDLVSDQNRIIYGSPAGKGQLASITATAAGNTKTVVNAMYLQEGMVVDVLTTAGVNTGGLVGATITAINRATNVVTFDASVTATTAMGIYRTGNYGLEPNGFWDIIDDTLPLHGLDPATQPKWKAIVQGTAGGSSTALIEVDMVKVCDNIRIASQKRPSVIFTSLGVRRAYFDLLKGDRRFTDQKSYPGGFKGLPFQYGDEIPLVEDTDAPPNVMWFLNESSVKEYREKPWHYADDDGDILKWVRDYDLWEGMMRQYWEFGCSHRNTNGRLQGIQEK